MAAFTATGAWVAAGNIARNPNINYAADAAASLIGLNGDATVADAAFRLPADWVAIDDGVATIQAVAGRDQAWTAYCAGAATPNQRAAWIASRTRVSIQFATNPWLAGAAATSAVSANIGVVYPWQIALVSYGAPAAACSMVVIVEYLWSASSGRDT